MSLLMVTEALRMMEEKDVSLGAEDKKYIFMFAFQTGDMELTEKLIDELAFENAVRKSIIEKYEEMRLHRPDWVEKIENLVVALEMYRMEEEKAIQRIAEFLRQNGIEIEEEAIKNAKTDDIKKMVADIRQADTCDEISFEKAAVR